jgi:NADH dehydrogenase/NADH:ubiquinone oxidoreductase subunit G
MTYCFFYRGALTSKPYSFAARPWELKSVESVDFFDSTGSSIKFDTRGDKILRVLPRINENINEEWISDRIRFSVDGFRVQRIDRPFVQFDKVFHSLSWSKFVNLIHKSILLFYKSVFLKGLALLSNSYTSTFFSFPFQVKDTGPFVDFETSVWLNFFENAFFLKKKRFGSKTAFLNFRSDFLIPTWLKDLFRVKNLLLISINPRFEAPVFNIRLRQSVIKFGNNVSSFGQRFFSNFNLLVNAGILSLVNFLNGNHWLCSYFTSKNSLILSNSSFANSINFFFFNSFINKQGLVGVFNRYSSYINLSESGVFVDTTDKDRLYRLGLFIGGSSKVDFSYYSTNVNLVSTSHGFKQLSNFDFILPSSAPFERNSTFINLEGRLQLSRIVLNSPNNVLDLKDSLIILITLFFNDNYNKELIYKLSIFLVGGVWAQFFLRKNQRSLWIFINKLLNSFGISKSSFIKGFYSSVLEYVSYLSVREKSLYLDKGNYCDFVIGKQQDEFLFINKNSSCCFESPDDFYVQDEIGFSSPTMLAASERMGVFYKTY